MGTDSAQGTVLISWRVVQLSVRHNSDAALTGGSSKPGPLDKRSQALLAADLGAVINQRSSAD